MSIITYPLNGVVYSAEDVATYLCTRTSGVYSKETNFAVSITGTRQITVAPGLAWINYDDFKGVSVCSREENVLTVPEADNTLNRVDRVVLQFDTSENIAAIKLKTGTPAVAAQPPDILQNHNQYELGLCTISVPAGSTAVTAADITDTRADETVCGVMRDGVTGIPTAQLQTQAKAMLDSLQAEVDSRSFYTRAEVDALLKSVNGLGRVEGFFKPWVMRFLRGGGLVALLPVVQQVEIIGQHPQAVGDVCPLLVRQATLGRRQSDGIGGRLVRVKPEIMDELLGGLPGVQVEQLGGEVDGISVGSTAKAIIIVVVQLHAGVAVGMERTAHHAMAVGLHAVHLSHLPNGDGGLDLLIQAQGYSSFVSCVAPETPKWELWCFLFPA